MIARFQRSPDIESAPLQDEVILFHAPSKKFCVLNGTASFMWSQLNEPVTREEIALRVEQSFSAIETHQVARDVESCLQEMLALGLVLSVEGDTADQGGNI